VFDNNLKGIEREIGHGKFTVAITSCVTHQNGISEMNGHDACLMDRGNTRCIDNTTSYFHVLAKEQVAKNN
jgi:hypothetical protein